MFKPLQAAIAEREQLQNHNTQLQHKLAEYFRKKKSDDQRQEMDKNVTDQEQRYLKYMCEWNHRYSSIKSISLKKGWFGFHL